MDVRRVGQGQPLIQIVLQSQVNPKAAFLFYPLYLQHFTVVRMLLNRSPVDDYVLLPVGLELEQII